MTTLARHKRTAQQYQDWLSETKNSDRKVKDKIKMFDSIADAHYNDVKNRVIEKKEKVLKEQRQRKPKVKKF